MNRQVRSGKQKQPLGASERLLIRGASKSRELMEGLRRKRSLKERTSVTKVFGESRQMKGQEKQEG